jgi:hypothetical protein
MFFLPCQGAIHFSLCISVNAVILDCCRVQDLDHTNRDGTYMCIANLKDALFVDPFFPCNNCALHVTYGELCVQWYVMHLLITSISEQ